MSTLASLIDDDILDAFERFVASLEDKKTKDVFACWRLCREHKDASEFDPLEFAEVRLCSWKQLEKRLVEDFWRTAVDYHRRLRKMLERSVSLLCTPTVKRLYRSTKCAPRVLLSYIHLAYDQFKTTQDYKEYCVKKISVSLSRRVRECSSTRSQGSRGFKERREDAQVFDEVESAVTPSRTAPGKGGGEAWTSLKHSSEKTERVMIGRDHKCDVAVDDDKRVARTRAHRFLEGRPRRVSWT